MCFQDWSLAVHSFLRAAEIYRSAAMLDSAANGFKEAGIHTIQSDHFSHDDIGMLECLSLTDRIFDEKILGHVFAFKGDSFIFMFIYSFIYSWSRGTLPFGGCVLLPV